MTLSVSSLLFHSRHRVAATYLMGSNQRPYHCTFSIDDGALSTKTFIPKRWRLVSDQVVSCCVYDKTQKCIICILTFHTSGPIQLLSLSTNELHSVQFYRHSASFSFIFGLFKQTSLQFLHQIYVKKCPSSIRYRDSNLRPSERESLPITTRPGLPPMPQDLSSSPVTGVIFSSCQTSQCYGIIFHRVVRYKKPNCLQKTHWRFGNLMLYRHLGKRA